MSASYHPMMPMPTSPPFPPTIQMVGTGVQGNRVK
jgi:hypothetical protein